MGNWCAIRYSSDNISNYIELMDGYSIVEVDVPAAWDGKKIGELDVRRKYQITILGIKNGEMDMNVGTDTVLHSGQHMLILGKHENIQRSFAL